jgi:hypothetical protein
VISRLLSWCYHCNYLTRGRLVRSNKAAGSFNGFQEATSEPAEKQRNWQHVIWCLISSTQAIRVAIVSSVIMKIFNPYKRLMVTIQPSVLDAQWISVYSYLLPVFCCCSSVLWILFVSLLFCSVCFCSIIQCSVICLPSVIFCPYTGIVFQVFWSPYLQPSSNAINIIQETAPSFVLVYEVRAYYLIDISGISGTNFSKSG